MAKKRKMDEAHENGLVINNIEVGQLNRGHKTIDSWSSALRAAENLRTPQRKKLYDHLLDIDTDLTVISSWAKRERAIKTIPFEWMGLENETYIENFQAPWFIDLKTQVLKYKAYGYTLIELIKENNLFEAAKLIPRQNVNPELEIVSKHMYGREGYPYKEPPYNNYILEVGDKKDLGLLSRIIPYVLLKRLNMAHHSQFNEMFGFPLRIYYYDPMDESSRQQVSKQAETQGAAAYVVLPKGTEVDMKESNPNGSAATFESLYKILNGEIIISILGNTLTTTNDGVGSNALGKVHQEVEHGVHLEDRLFIEYYLNWNFKDLAIKHGYPLQGIKGKFIDMDELPKDKKADYMIKLIQQGYSIDPEYIYSELGIEVGEKVEVKPSQTASQQNSLRLLHELEASYKHVCPNNPQMKKALSLSFEDDLQKIIDNIIQKLHNGEYSSGDVDEAYYNLLGTQLWEAVEDSFGTRMAEVDTTSPVKSILQQFRDNVYVFSGFKNYQFLRMASDLLIDENGNRRPFNKFRDAVLEINEQYNVNYLRAEYEHAQATAQMADKERRFRENAGNVPNAKFVTAGDERVRASHRRLDGLIMPISDERWRKFTPPLDWGCRCNKIATNEDISNPKDYQNLPEVPEMFSYSPLDDGVIFPENHPYYQVAEKDRANANNNFGLTLPGNESAENSFLGRIKNLFKRY